MTETDWKIMKLRRKLRRRKERMLLEKIKKGVVALILIGVAILFTGAYNGPARLVETTYTVRANDTLWGISEEYLQKNTGGGRYILEFIEGIKELNPELVKNKGQVYPGQVLRINYWVEE